jgi:ATP-dependent exoDNAse (exonuclease V) alpha subunit
VDYTVARTQGERIILRAKDGQEKRWNPAKEKAQGVYAARAVGLAIGDEIMFRENQGRGADKITNGATGRVTATKDNTVAVTLSDGRKITLDPAQGHSIDYGWCRTIHSSQGATVDRVLVAGEASRVATAESAYVACSRARDALQIITDNPDRLEKSWSKWAERQTALDAARAAPETDLNTLAAARAEAAAELGEAGDLVEARNQAARSRTRRTPTAELEME